MVDLMKTFLALIVACAFSSSVLATKDALDGWVPSSQTSSQLAKAKWKLTGTTGLSWPDGRQAIITFWMSNDGKIRRCVDYMKSDMVSTGGKCMKPIGRVIR